MKDVFTKEMIRWSLKELGKDYLIKRIKEEEKNILDLQDIMKLKGWNDAQLLELEESILFMKRRIRRIKKIMKEGEI